MPGHEEHEPWRPFQHLERRYFDPGPTGFGVWRAFGGIVGMMICNDRRWPETYRVMGLQGVELILVRLQHADPLRARPEPGHPPGLPQRARDAGRRLPERHWVVGVAKGGVEEGVDALAQSLIIAPIGPDRGAGGAPTGDELIAARCDLDWCARYKGTLFDFDRYRRPEVYTPHHQPDGCGRAARGVTDDARVHAQRPAGRRRRRPPPPARRAARGARRHLAEGRLLAVGPVRVLHRAGRRQGDGRRASSRWPRSAGKSIVTLEGVDEDERDRYADAFAACGGLQCGFCIPGIVVRAKAQIDKKGADLTRDEMARHLGAHLCRCTGYVKILDAIEAVAKGKELGAGAPRRRRQPRRRSTRRGELALGDRGYIDDIRVAGHAPRRAAPHRPRPGRRRCASTRRRRRAARRRRRRVHRRRRARRAAGRAHPQGLAGAHPGRRAHSYLGDVLAVVVAETRQQAARPPPSWSRSSTTCCARSPTRSPPSTSDRDRRVGHRRQRAVARPRYARGDVDAALGRQRPRRARGVPDPAHRARLPRAGVDAGRARPPTAARCTCTPAARACGTTATTSPRVLGVDHDRVTVELVSNGGAFGGKEDMANQAQTALAAWLLQRPVKCTLSREESLLHPPQAPPDPHGVLGRLRRRRHGSPRCRCAPSATRAPTPASGMKVLERAAGHASGPYHVPAIDVRADRRPHQQPGVRRVPRLRRQPGPVRHGGRASTGWPSRSASAAGRSASAT